MRGRDQAHSWALASSPSLILYRALAAAHIGDTELVPGDWGVCVCPNQPLLKTGLGDSRPLASRGPRKGPSWGRENSGKARTKPAARQLGDQGSQPELARPWSPTGSTQGRPLSSLPDCAFGSD